VQDGADYTRVGNEITPAGDFNGTLTVPVTVNDGTADSDVFNVSVTVTPVNDEPAITDQDPLSTPEETALTITLGNLTVADPDNAYPADFTLTVRDGTNYTRVGNEITPAGDFNGTLTVPVTVNDGTADSDVFNVSVTVTPVNDEPEITGQDPLSTAEEAPLTITLGDLTVTDPDNTYPDDFTLAVQDGANYTRIGNEITPAGDFNGTLTVPVTVNDGTVDSNVFNVSVTVTPVNDEPEITGQDTLSTAEEAPLTITLGDLTVTDPDNTYPDDFTLAVQDGANYTRIGNEITPASDFNGTLTVPLTVNDGAADSDVFNVSVTVTPVNDEPAITGQEALVTPFETAITIALSDLTVLDPDNTYPDDFTLSVQDGTNYSRVGNEITPAGGFDGILTVPVTVNDGTADSGVFNLSVTVTQFNYAPEIIGQDPLSTQEETALSITLADLSVTDADDTYPDDFTLSVQDGTNYTRVGNQIAPAADFNGLLTVPVTVNDGIDDSNVYNLSVTVTPVNDQPQITGQTPLDTLEETPLTIVLGDLTVADPDNTYPDDFTLSVRDGSNYSRVGNEITPAADFSGTLTVPVTVNDGLDDSGVFNLSVTVTPLNEPPQITGQNPVETPEETPLMIGLDDLVVTDPDNVYPADFTLAVQDGTNYTRVGNQITPVDDFNGVLTVPVTVNDGADGSNVFNLSVTVTAVNDQPQITGQDPLSTAEETPLTISLGDLTVTDPDNSYPGDFTLAVQDGANYTRVGNEITPATDFSGTLTVPVAVNDGADDSDVFNLGITVAPVNDAPQITGQDPLDTPEETPLTIVLGDLTVTDPDNTYPTDFTLAVQDGSNYTRVGNQITPDDDFNGTLTVPVKVNDGADDSDVFNVSVTVTPVNDEPQITAQNPLSTAEETTLGISLTDLTVIDPDNAYPADFTLAVQDGTNYTRVGNQITPATDFNGVLTVPVTVNDGAADSGVFNLSVTVTPVNDEPQITGQGPLSTLEDTLLTITLNDLTVADPDNAYPADFTLAVHDGLMYTRVGNQITPTPDFNGVLTVPVTVNDGAADSDAFNLGVTVAPVNDEPNFTADDPPMVIEGAATHTIPGWATFDPGATNESGQTATYAVDNFTNIGLFLVPPAVAPDGTLTYSVAASAFGTSTFDVDVQDDGGVDNGGDDTSPAQTFTLTVVADLGTVDLHQQSNLQPSDGVTWLRFAARRDGVLTAELSAEGLGPQTEIALFADDGSGQPGEELKSGTSRIDLGLEAGEDQAIGGQQYFVRVTGLAAAADLTITNLVQLSPDGSSASVFGGDGDDTIEVTPGDSWSLDVNGTSYELDTTDLQLLDENAGHDQVTINDSDDADQFVAWPKGAVMITPDGNCTASGFETIVARADNGGHNEVRFYDSTGNDTFVADPDFGRLSGKGYSLEARSFQKINVFAAAGGHDVAELTGSAADDVFYAGSIEGALRGEGFFNRVKWFEEIHGDAAAGGDDLALLFDSPGDDTFVATPDYAEISGGGFLGRAESFYQVISSATAGGHDVAQFNDGAGRDKFIGAPVESMMADVTGGTFAQVYLNRAKYFEEVHAHATDGDYDRANLYDSYADDTYEAYPQLATLSGGAHAVSVHNFNGVHAYCWAGGKDVARLHGSAAADGFFGTPANAAMYSPTYFNRAEAFDEVYADAGEGDDDAYLYDSALGIDLLSADTDWARLSSYAATDYLLEVTSFDYVKATATTDGDKKDVPLLTLLDFDLDLDGPWEDL